MSIRRLGTAFLAIQWVFLLSAPPSAGQEATGGRVRELIITATTSIVYSDRENAFRQLAEVEREEVARTFRVMLASPDELPDYVHAIGLVHGLIRCLGEQQGVLLLREVLMGAEEGEWPSGVEQRRLPALDTPAGWALFEDLAGAAQSKAVREQARERLWELSSVSKTFMLFQPSKPLGFYYRGLAHLSQAARGREPRVDAPRNARADLEQAIALDPTLVQAHIQRANALIRSKRFAEAIESLDRVIAQNPGYGRLESHDIGEGVGWAYELRSDAHRALGHEAEADSDLRAAQRLRREAREAYLRSANGLKEEAHRADGWLLHGAVVRGSWEDTSTFFPKALPHLNNIVRYHPDQALYRLKRGMLHHEFGEVAQALADYDGFIAAVPGAPYAQYLRAKALEALGREDEAAVALAACQQGIAAFDPPQLPAELPVAERPRLGLDYAQVVELAKAPRENAETLARVLLGAGTDGPTWSKAIWVLEELDDGQLIPLVPYLEQATLVCEMHYPGRLTLVSLLGRAGQASSIPYLLHAATDARPEAFAWRKKAVEALGELPREVAEPALQRLVLASEDRKVVNWSVRQLLELSGESYRHFCVRTMLEAPREYQIRAAKVLGEPLSLLVLLEIAGDENAEGPAREEARAALESWPSTPARLALADMG